MEAKQKKSNVVPLGNKVSEKTSEIGNTFSETAELAPLNLAIHAIKHSVDLDKEISKNDKEESLALLKAIESIQDDEIKAELLKEHSKSSNEQRKIRDRRIFFAKCSIPIVIGGAGAILWKLKK